MNAIYTDLRFFSILFLGVFAFSIMFVSGADFKEEYTRSSSFGGVVYAFLFLLFAFIIKDCYQASSWGKKKYNLYVCDRITLQPASLTQCVVRNLTVFIFFVEYFVLLFNKQQRRLGDLMAGTVVVEKRGEVKSEYHLTDIAKALVISFSTILVFSSPFLMLLRSVEAITAFKESDVDVNKSKELTDKFKEELGTLFFKIEAKVYLSQEANKSPVVTLFLQSESSETLKKDRYVEDNVRKICNDFFVGQYYSGGCKMLCVNGGRSAVSFTFKRR